MRIHISSMLAVAIPVMLACASRSVPQAGVPRSDSRVITRAELDQVDVRNAYEAVERLRPRWLVVRSGPRSFQMETEVVVFQDQLFLGNQEVLERIGTEGIYSIRYLDGPTAKASLPQLGNRHVQGAIVISMRPPNQKDDPSAGA